MVVPWLDSSYCSRGHLFSDKITRWFMPTPAVSSWTSRLWSGAGAAATSLIARVAGRGCDETVGFFAAFSDLLGHFRSRGEEVGRLLRDPRTVFLVVCAPDPARIVEAQVISEHLANKGCVPRAFIVNRVEEAFLPSPARSSARWSARLLWAAWKSASRPGRSSISNMTWPCLCWLR